MMYLSLIVLASILSGCGSPGSAPSDSGTASNGFDNIYLSAEAMQKATELCKDNKGIQAITSATESVCSRYCSMDPGRRYSVKAICNSGIQVSFTGTYEAPDAAGNKLSSIAYSEPEPVKPAESEYKVDTPAKSVPLGPARTLK